MDVKAYRYKEARADATTETYTRYYRDRQGLVLIEKVSYESKSDFMDETKQRVSEDDGKTWRGGLMLDTRDEVSYPDGTEDENGRIRIIYDWQRFNAREILMASFTEEDVLAGMLVSEGSQLKQLVNRAEGPRVEPKW